MQDYFNTVAEFGSFNMEWLLEQYSFILYCYQIHLSASDCADLLYMTWDLT